MKHQTTLTQQIIDNQKPNFKGGNVNKIASLLASVFSVLFSLSILKEAHKFVSEYYILVFLFVFIILFLVYNEYLKVRELRSKYLGKGGSIFIIVLTFLVSFSMSGVGIYFWTNHTLEQEVSNDQSIIDHKIQIENAYNIKIDSVEKTPVTSSPIINQLRSDLDWWDSRRAANIDERTYIRGKIDTISQQIVQETKAFNQQLKERIERLEQLKEKELQGVETQYKNTKKFIKKGNKISFIFFILVIITEVLIVILAKEKAALQADYQAKLDGRVQRKFLEVYRIISEILSRKDVITFDDVAHSPFLNVPDNVNELVKNKHIKQVYYLLGELGVVGKGKGNEVQISKQDAVSKITNYYETILNL